MLELVTIVIEMEVVWLWSSVLLFSCLTERKVVHILMRLIPTPISAWTASRDAAKVSCSLLM